MTKVNLSERRIRLSSPAQLKPRIMVMGTYLHVPDNSRFASQHTPAMQLATRAAVFLDRDGVIVENVHFIRNPSQLRVLPDAAKALCMLQERFYVIVVTNQSGVARGLLTEDDLLAIHLKLVQHLATKGAILDAIYYCPHLPDATAPAYRLECNCRKPKPGMLLRAKYDWNIDMVNSFMIGDTPRDIEAGCIAGVKGILLGNGKTAPPNALEPVSDLIQAAHLILAQSDKQTVSR